MLNLVEWSPEIEQLLLRSLKMKQSRLLNNFRKNLKKIQLAIQYHKVEGMRRLTLLKWIRVFKTHKRMSSLQQKQSRSSTMRTLVRINYITKKTFFESTTHKVPKLTNTITWIIIFTTKFQESKETSTGGGMEFNGGQWKVIKNGSKKRAKVDFKRSQGQESMKELESLVLRV